MVFSQERARGTRCKKIKDRLEVIRGGETGSESDSFSAMCYIYRIKERRGRGGGGSRGTNVV